MIRDLAGSPGGHRGGGRYRGRSDAHYPGDSAFLWGFASTTAVTGGFNLTGNLNPDPKPFGDIFTSGSGARTILTFGTFTTGPAGTTISLEWAQTVTNPATTATINSGSFIQYTKIR
ncbi:MAG: hypothetical protein IIC29_01245 [Chloroflexi bacterium]|nr:hypothetical protein [Chloroflexota bacterium]